jgi:hypothetical protein
MKTEPTKVPFLARAILFAWPAVKFTWYAGISLVVVYFLYQIVDNAYQPPEPSRLERLCAEIQRLYEDAGSDTDRGKYDELLKECEGVGTE